MIEIFSFVSSCCHFNSNSTSAACRSRPIQFNSIHTHEVYVWEPVFQVWVSPNPGGCERPEGKVGGWNTPNGIILASCFFQTEKYCEVQRKRGMKAVFSLLPSFICTQSAGLSWVCRERIDAAFYSPSALLHLWHQDSVMMDQRETHTASLMHPRLKRNDNNNHFHLFTSDK